jgi:AbrB family looped-hinge helix DNA binding protein
MNVRIDSAGRIVVPKRVRERLGLKQNTELDLKETAEGIILKPVRQKSGMVRDKHGWITFTGKPVGRIDWDRIVEEDREARDREIGGW